PRRRREREVRHETGRSCDRRPSGRRRAGLRRHGRQARQGGPLGRHSQPHPRRGGDPRHAGGAARRSRGRGPGARRGRAALPRLRRRLIALRPGRRGRADRGAARAAPGPGAQPHPLRPPSGPHPRSCTRPGVLLLFRARAARDEGAPHPSPGGGLLLHAARLVRAGVRGRRDRQLGRQAREPRGAPLTDLPAGPGRGFVWPAATGCCRRRPKERGAERNHDRCARRGSAHQGFEPRFLLRDRGSRAPLRQPDRRDVRRAVLEPAADRGGRSVLDPARRCPLKIGISCYPTYGGSGIVATELAMALAEAGDEVHVISYALPSRLTFTSSRIYFHEVVVPRYPLFEYPPYSLALATKMVEVARHQKLDVMHVHYAVPNAVSAVLARQILAPQPLPVVTTLHGTDVTLVGADPNYL